MAASSTKSDLANSLYSEAGIHLEEQGVSTWFCGLLRKVTPRVTRTIPWSDVISATAIPADDKEVESLEITYARHESDKPQAAVVPLTKTILLSPSIDSTDNQKTAQSIIEQAYRQSQYRKRILVLVNPFSGKGNGTSERKFYKHIQPIFEAAKCEFKVVRTEYRGHAVEIARDMEIDNFDVVACVSGDGVPHEVFNGLAKRKDARRALAKIAVVQMPCGSANGMSWNLFNTGTPSLAALRLIKGFRTPMDLVSVTHPSLSNPSEIERTMSFLTQSVGVIADCDLGTEHLRFLGEIRFALGLLWAILTKKTYPCDIAMEVAHDDKEVIRENAKRAFDADPDYLNPEPRNEEDGLPPLQFGTISDDLPPGWELVPYDKIGNFYCGNVLQVQEGVPFFPMVQPSDGLVDLVTINGDIPTWPALKMMDDCPANKLFDREDVKYRKVKGYRLIPKNKKGYIAVDGEPIPHAGFQVEVHQKLATTLTLTGLVFEGPGIPTKPGT